MKKGKNMKLYIRVENNFINYVDVEENNVCNEEVEANSLDEMFIELEKLGNIDEETENKISELFESEVNKESLTSYNIKHWVSNRSFGELIDMFNCGEIKKPAMQREFIWDAQKSSRLIESIILGLPIPPLFLLEVGNNEYELIDGFQRLTTVTNYVNGEPWNAVEEGKKKRKSKLSGKIMEELVGKSFDQLEPEKHINETCLLNIKNKNDIIDGLFSEYEVYKRELAEYDSYYEKVLEAFDQF